MQLIALIVGTLTDDKLKFRAGSQYTSYQSDNAVEVEGHCVDCEYALNTGAKIYALHTTYRRGIMQRRSRAVDRDRADDAESKATSSTMQSRNEKRAQ